MTEWDFKCDISLLQVTFLLFSPTLLYLLSMVLCPDLPDNRNQFNLKAYHAKIRTIFFTILALFFLVLIPEALLMSSPDNENLFINNIFRMFVAFVFLITPYLINKYKKLEIVIPVFVVSLLLVKRVLAY